MVFQSSQKNNQEAILTSFVQNKGVLGLQLAGVYMGESIRPCIYKHIYSHKFYFIFANKYDGE
jgi:hypothetical protein